MRANQFVKKAINESLGDTIELLEFFEEPEFDDPTMVYYQIKMLYNNTIIYSYHIYKHGRSEPTQEAILTSIEKTIQKYKRATEGKNIKALKEFIDESIRVRFYEKMVAEYNYIEDAAVQWTADLEKWIQKEIEAGVQNGVEFIGIYDSCIRRLTKNQNLN